MVSRRGLLRAAGTMAVFLAGCLAGSDPRASPGTDGTTDWPMARADSANTAYVGDAKAPREEASERWTVETAPATGTPAIADGSVYLPTRNALVALDAETGTEQWRVAPSEGPSSPIVHDGCVYTAVRSEGVYALDAQTGKKQWKRVDEEYSALSLVTHPTVDEPWLIAGTGSSDLFKLDPQTGEQTWQTELDGRITAFGFRPSSLYVGTEGNAVYSFVPSATAPTEGWRQNVGSAVRSLLPTSDGVAVHTSDGSLRLLQKGAFAGTPKWTVASSVASSTPVHVTPNQAFYTAGNDRLAAIQDEKGNTEWEVGGRYDEAAPVAAGDTLYVSDGDGVHAFALDGGVGIGTVRTGAHRWFYSTEHSIGELAIGDGALFAASDDGKKKDRLYCLEPS